MAITTRTAKGSPLTFAEMDANWDDLKASVLGTAISFTAAIPFSNIFARMPQVTVSGPLAFTANSTGALEGAVVDIDLIADGANPPSFTGFRQLDGTSGYQDIPGVRNMIRFSYRFGIPYYTVHHQLGMAPEPGYPLAQVVRFSSLFNMTESGAALTGWSYAATSASFFGNNAVAALSMPPGVDAEVQHTLAVVATGDTAIFVDANIANAPAYNQTAYGIWVASAGNAVATESNSFPTVAGSGSFINGDSVKISRVGSTMTAYKSRAGVLTTLRTWTGVPTGRLYIGIGASGVGTTSHNPRGTNLT